MGKRQIIGLLMLLLPVLAFAQASGGQVTRPTKKTQQTNKRVQSSKKMVKADQKTEQPEKKVKEETPVASKDAILLKKMLAMPLGKINCDHLTSSLSVVKNALSPYYTLEDASDENFNQFYLFSKDNSTLEDFSIYGFRFFFYSLTFLRSPTSSLERVITYSFLIPKLQIESPYFITSQIEKDFNDMGIPMRCEKKDDPKEKVKGSFIQGDKWYEMVLKDYKDKWELFFKVTIIKW